MGVIEVILIMDSRFNTQGDSFLFFLSSSSLVQYLLFSFFFLYIIFLHSIEVVGNNWPEDGENVLERSANVITWKYDWGLSSSINFGIQTSLLRRDYFAVIQNPIQLWFKSRLASSIFREELTRGSVKIGDNQAPIIVVPILPQLVLPPCVYSSFLFLWRIGRRTNRCYLAQY